MVSGRGVWSKASNAWREEGRREGMKANVGVFRIVRRHGDCRID